MSNPHDGDEDEPNYVPRAPSIVPIVSHADFYRRANDALYEARRRADTDRAGWMYTSIAAMLASFIQMTTDGRKLTAGEFQAMEAVSPSLRPHADAAAAEMLDILDTLFAYFREWPAGEAHVDAPPEPEGDPEEDPGGGQPIIPGLDVLALAIHQLRDEMREAPALPSERAREYEVMARAMGEARVAMYGELKEMLSAVEEWVTTGCPPADHEVKRASGLGSSKQLLRYLPRSVIAIQRVRGSFIAWRNRVQTAADCVEVSTFDDFVCALHCAINEAAILAKLSSDHEGLREITNRLRWLQGQAGRWVSELAVPIDRESPMAETLARDFDLPNWQQISSIRNGVRQLSDLLKSWSTEVIPYFRKTLYETAIDLEMLRVVSATRGLDRVGDSVQQLLYVTSNGKEPAPHERKDSELADAIKRELDIHCSSVTLTFVQRVYAIDRFWSEWSPPTGIDGDPNLRQPSPAVKPKTPNDAEREILCKITKFDPGKGMPEGLGEQGDESAGSGYTRAYFHHCLNSAIRDFKPLSMKFKFSRAIGAELRAIRRATDRGRTPTAEERHAIGWAFRNAGALMTKISGVMNEMMTDGALSVHRYFQQWPADDNTQKWPPAPAGMIADPKHFAKEISDILADAGCILVLWPNHDVWIEVYRQLARIYQSSAYGRRLDDAELAEGDRAIAKMPEIPPGTLAAIPGFPTDFPARVKIAHDYFRGRRISSAAAFDEMLRVVIDESREIQRASNWAEDEAPLGAIDRQLRAMRRWTTAGRRPTPSEREATRDALAVVIKLKGLERWEEWGKRVAELSAAFYGGPPEGSGATFTAPGPVASKQEFALLLEDALRDCRRLSGPSMTRPQGAQVIWSNIATHLAVVQRMLDQDRVPTRRERSEIHGALTGLAADVPNPCPSIHDFLSDITERFRRIDDYYTWMVTAGPYAGKETGNVDEAGLTCVTLGGEMRVAFVRTAGAEPGIYVSVAEKVVTKEHAGEIEIDFMRYLPSTKGLMRLAPCEGWTPTEIKWNAHSDFLAYLIPGKKSQVGWSETRKAGEKGRVEANAFAWSSSGHNLVLLDVPSRSIFRVNAESGAMKALAELPPDISTALAPQITIAPGGEVLLYTYGRTDGSIDLSMIAFQGSKPVSRVIKRFTGASAVLPFWSQNSPIACLVIGKKGSEILSIPSDEGEAEVLYQSKNQEGGFAPAWSTTGKFIAFFKTARAGNEELVLFDCDTRETIPLLKPGVVRGRLSFGEETVCIENGQAAVILWPHISHQRTVMEKF